MYCPKSENPITRRRVKKLILAHLQIDMPKLVTYKTLIVRPAEQFHLGKIMPVALLHSRHTDYPSGHIRSRVFMTI